MLGHLTRETRFLTKDRGALFWLLLAFVLSVVAVSFGIAEVREQRETIATLIEEDAADRANALEGQEDWASPTSLVERAFEKLAGTDARSMIGYEDQVRAYHGELRAFYYPLMFPEEPYDEELLDGLPSFTPPS